MRLTRPPFFFNARHLFVRGAVVFLVALIPVVASCDSSPNSTGIDNSEQDGLTCIFSERSPADFLNEGANRGEITPVNNPELVSANEAEERLPAFSDTDRILGLPPSFHDSYQDMPLAVPLDVLFESEVMNLDGWADRPLAITFCPLTSSTLVFDREVVDGARFEVSGLLFKNGNEEHSGNLVMVPEDGESLWPQMSLGAVCGSNRGTALNKLPAIEMTWKRWKELYPNTEVAIERSESSASADSGPKETFPSNSVKASAKVPLGRVLGIPNRSRVGGGDGGVAVPFDELDDGSSVRVVEVETNRETFTVFWDLAARSAMAYRTGATSYSVEDGHIVDSEGNVWSVAGRAIEGPRRGEHLDPVESAYIASGRAWFDFQPETDEWTDSP